jgi:hypothetical protein
MVMAEIVLDGKAVTVDVTPLSLTRFREGHIVEERAVI